MEIFSTVNLLFLTFFSYSVYFTGFQPIMTVVSAVSEKPKGTSPLAMGCHGYPVIPTPTPDVAFLGTQQSTSHVTDVEDTTAFLKEVERTARNEVQV